MMDLREQKAIVVPRLERACVRVAAEILREQLDVAKLAERRLIQGYHEFGDEAFRKRPAELRRERREELADAIIYDCIEWHLTNGLPHEPRPPLLPRPCSGCGNHPLDCICGRPTEFD